MIFKKKMKTMSILQLHEKGFKNLDAIDGSAAMMEIVKKLNVYTNFYHAIVGSNKLDIADGELLKGEFTNDPFTLLFCVVISTHI